MSAKALSKEILRKKSYLCIGLDTDINKIPIQFKRYRNPVLEFNKMVIESTKDLCVSYKINSAFYEQMGSQGWEIMKQTLEYIPDNIFTIADAKRGDIGNTARMYAKAFFEKLSFDSITLSPYMGMDTLRPFLEYEDKTLIILALTSNPGSQHFEMLQLENGKKLYEQILTDVSKEFPTDRTMFVIGATHPDKIAETRKCAPDNFFLVPGVGAQGGDLNAISLNGMNNSVGLLINVSRGVIYAGNDSKNIEVKVREAALGYRNAMKNLLQNA